MAGRDPGRSGAQAPVTARAGAPDGPGAHESGPEETEAGGRSSRRLEAAEVSWGDTEPEVYGTGRALPGGRS